MNNFCLSVLFHFSFFSFGQVDFQILEKVNSMLNSSYDSIVLDDNTNSSNLIFCPECPEMTLKYTLYKTKKEQLLNSLILFADSTSIYIDEKDYIKAILEAKIEIVSENLLFSKIKSQTKSEISAIKGDLSYGSYKDKWLGKKSTYVFYLALVNLNTLDLGIEKNEKKFVNINSLNSNISSDYRLCYIFQSSASKSFENYETGIVISRFRQVIFDIKNQIILSNSIESESMFFNVDSW